EDLIGLFGKIVLKLQRTFERFARVAKRERSWEHGEASLFQRSTFHRIIPSFMIQGGDFTRGDGRGGESIYGDKFADENFKLKHTGPALSDYEIFNGVLAKRLDGHHVVFGKVLSGMKVVRKIEAQGQSSGEPKGKVIILDSGEVSL
ncbi:hypothetical protein HID58_094929, partial [Brassica napus]